MLQNRDHVSTVKDKVIIVDFYEEYVLLFLSHTYAYGIGSWCPPCKVLSPLLERVEKDPTLIGATMSSLDLITLKGELVPNLFDEHCIRSIPTVMAFYNGTKVGEFVGAKDIPKMKEWYATLVPRLAKGV
ncbi:hypothetical protein Clacol_006819 [Clathrus columnatus]|uniref:Thioredoxin domain-containing protein n=1 Tax=Clathrus columnatus TaxID=1419009 RepID=A0AAV5AJB9_9AGAM|nr:hypothetical protein Clacol_006819 [Clathrus columnatus]